MSHHVPSSHALAAALVAAALQSTPAAAQTEHTVDTQTGLHAWHRPGPGLGLELNQRLPDQSRAYFQARGFTPQQADRIAEGCVFQAVVRNLHPALPLQVDLAQWRVLRPGHAPQPPKLEAAWQQEWQENGSTEAARIAFRWSLFPTAQRFEPGDWNMGMITLGLPSGTPFDLEIAWREGEELRRDVLPQLRCAADHPAAPE